MDAIDMTAANVKDEVEATMAKCSSPFDILVNNAGYANAAFLGTFKVRTSLAKATTSVSAQTLTFAASKGLKH